MEEAELCFPQMSNLSCSAPRPDPDQQLFNSLVLGCISALATGLNLLVILSIACFRQLQSPTHLILMSLAVSDFLVGLVILPVIVRTTGVCWVWGEAACGLYNFLVTALVQASICSMVLVSVDRYIAVVDPLHYQRRMSHSKVNLSICLSWVYAALYCFIIVNNLLNPFKHVHCLGKCEASIFAEADIALGFVIPLGIILFLYAHIFRMVIMKTRATHNNPSTSQGKQRSEWKAARNLGSVVIFYIVCYLPYYCIWYSGDTVDLSGNAYMVSALMVFLNSVFNPLLYVLIYPRFRKAFRAILTLKILHFQTMVL